MSNNLSPALYHPPQSEESYSVSFDNSKCHVRNQNSFNEFALKVEVMDRSLRVLVDPLTVDKIEFYELSAALEYLFTHFTQTQNIHISLSPSSAQKLHYADFYESSTNELQIPRNRFFQNPKLWLYEALLNSDSEEWAVTGSFEHPIRPHSQYSLFYRRFVPTIGQSISFRKIDLDRDLDIFHRWHNEPRVANLWELDKSKSELRDYLLQGLHDAHQIPMIVQMNEVPIGYFEIYWAREDRIAPYYDSAPFDRGFHFLIGEEKYLGVRNTSAVLSSVAHFIYLDNLRTERIVAEPRSDNKAVIKYVQIVPGWKFVKEFDFPHKRAALLIHSRLPFFESSAL